MKECFYGRNFRYVRKDHEIFKEILESAKKN